MSELLYDSQGKLVIKTMLSDYEKENDISFHWSDYLGLILREYANYPDSHVISIGDWSNGELPRFRAFLRMDLGELRKLEADV